MSYQKRMKHHVVLSKMHILDINNSNKHFLSMFRQASTAMASCGSRRL